MASPTSSRKAPSLETIARYAVLGGWIFGIGGIMVAAAVLVPRLVERTAQAQASAPIRVVLANEPSWLPAEDREAIRVGVLKCLTGGPLDMEGLERARECAQRSGWYSEVQQARRPDIDQVVIEGTWAAPFALVSDATGEHLVDTGARLLPRSYAANTGPRLLRITGASQPRPAQAGSLWQGRDIAAALALASLVNSRSWMSQVAAIDLSTFQSEGTLRLRTDAGCEIVWGRSPGQENATEVPAHQKLAALQFLYDHRGRIDAGCEQRLDLRADVVGMR